ncbi:hypothetical protein [Micromonospora coxensis]|uniref:hypothetical protein n=1 Tax=Micromonospora coxensis TaxID=356852 RepID=UPI000B5AE565|nr:hypothetical protein [Micromonospora coxensis]
MENEAPAAGPDGRSTRPRDPAAPGLLGDRSSVATNVISAVTGLMTMVQLLRTDSLWLFWIGLGALVLVGVTVYQVRKRNWRAVLVSLVVLLVLGAVGGLLAVSRHPGRPPVGVAASTAPQTGGPSSGASASAPAAGSSETSGAPSAAAARPIVFSDVVQLDKKTGVDLDGRRAERRASQDAVVDLYLDWGYILYSSVRHSALYDDSNQGPEQGADARCRTYREDDRQSFAHHYVGGGNQQFCFTTSEGRPGWAQAVNSVGDGGLIVKVTVWEK